MSIIMILLIVLLVGFLAWIALTVIPMPEPFGKIFLAIVVTVLVLWLLQQFGVFTGDPHIKL